MPCSRYGNTLTRISESTAVLYGGNNFGPSGWANGDCWLLDLNKAKKLSNINSDKAHELVNDKMERAKAIINFDLHNAKEFININMDEFRDIIDVNLDKAKDLINIDLDKAKKIVDPSSVWTPVSNHKHLPRVHHRDASFSAFHHVKIYCIGDKTGKVLQVPF